MQVEEIESEEQARKFLPQGGGAYGLLMFVDHADSASKEAILKAGEHTDPRTLHVLDVERLPEVPAWFGLRRVPVLAVVADGSLLAMEVGCGPETLSRLDETANPLLRRIDEW